jgi:hypothetical protein
VPFSCSICEQESTRICAFCTKDACSNHICVRCGCCSDCCECDVPLDEPASEHAFIHTEPALPHYVETAPETFEPDAGAAHSEFKTPEAEPWPAAETQSTTGEESASDPFETPEV